ncbi:fatty acid 2-hydroxylase [Cylas formicarius]|uniref:fatty acid 2-hydroxylase n=1 Tax=Cylas formicarius TaxID=197179 RepID=UPI002958C1C1|nr:fatty acid 2-hydroxylase [Cylas formicarius]
MQKDGDFDVFYKRERYDIESFLRNHPGGVNYVKPYKGKDVQKRMEDTFHSDAAYYLFREYKAGRATEGSACDEEDLERLVDWNRPMLSQVGKLGDRYREWVLSPVDRHLILFGNPVLENLTITPWYIVPLIWIPVVLYLIRYGSEDYARSCTKDGSIILGIWSNISLGVLLWTLIEYSLHRWIFHMEPSGRSKAMIYFHFAIHGLHHKVPFDTRRLVFPPFPAAIIALILYKMFSFVIAESSIVLVFAGGILGYLIYDMIHFYLHYGAPSENSYFYRLKRYHNQHHFAHHDDGFGISSTFWDQIFGTAISLRKLNKSIKW